jgi:KipI family sensor histidine kinase inhibitor
VTGTPDQVRVKPYGEAALLLEVPADRVLATYDAVLGVLLGRTDVSARDVVPAARTILVAGLRGLDAEGLLGALTESRPGLEREQQREVEVPVTYDGEDLEEVARLWEMTTVEAVATHTATTFTVAFCGFSPGFAYCTGLPERLHVPRRRTPRTRVPAGSVGLAGEFTGVYPTASPGGWQLLGRTDLTLWDSAADRPATLSPGTVVRFVDVGAGQ